MPLPASSLTDMKGTAPDGLPPRINSGWRIGIVASRFHGEHVAALVRGAEDTLQSAGILRGNIRTFAAPGSFEIPLLGAALAKSKAVDALLGFGIILQGETHHAQLLAESVVSGMMDVQTQHGIPFAFEVLYVDSLAQAVARAQGADNKGAEAARTVLWALSELERIRNA